VTSLDEAGFKDVLGHYASGLVVVAARTSHGPVGFTCQTFGSLSLNPPLVIFAASSLGHSWSLVRRSDQVGISILSSDQAALARRFALSGVDKFDGVSWEGGPGGAPLLGGALAHIEGTMTTVVAHGDHDLVVVEVSYVGAYGGRPLIYFRRDFGELD
jgi:3-hydroxy-9,10-secoandrosta-1,3,5(10)-triene-9,17-dione monooxygenase reductase component